MDIFIKDILERSFTKKEIERLVFEYNSFLIDLKNEEFKGYFIKIIFNGIPHSDKMNVGILPVSKITNSYFYQYDNIELYKIIKHFQNKINKYKINIDLVNYLIYNGYKLKEKYQNTYHYSIENLNKLYNLIDDIKNADEADVKEKSDIIKKINSYNL